MLDLLYNAGIVRKLYLSAMFKQNRLIFEDLEEYKNRAALEKAKQELAAGRSDLKNMLELQEAAQKLGLKKILEEMKSMIEFFYEQFLQVVDGDENKLAEMKDALLKNVNASSSEVSDILNQPTKAKQEEALQEYRKWLLRRFKKETKS